MFKFNRARIWNISIWVVWLLSISLIACIWCGKSSLLFNYKDLKLFKGHSLQIRSRPRKTKILRNGDSMKPRSFKSMIPKATILESLLILILILILLLLIIVMLILILILLVLLLLSEPTLPALLIFQLFVLYIWWNLQRPKV